jgi:putative membrane-bound dehydrogenase-like protein
VKRSIATIGLVLLGVSLVPAADPPDKGPTASPLRPGPTWLQIIDQGQNDPRLKGYFTPEGIKVEIVADAPVVINPVGMTFAEDGTPYVLEWRPSPGEAPKTLETVSYKDGSKRLLTTLKKGVKDAVKALRDSQSRGVYDQAEVVLEAELPSSILLHDGWIYLSGQGTVRRYKQSKPGGPYDIQEVIAQGFFGYGHQQVSGMSLGNDGWLTLTVGDDDAVVEGSDGSRAMALRTGAVFRCKPDGSKMQLFAQGLCNPYRDVAFDASFNLFHVDSESADGGKSIGCRLVHVAEGNDFGWRSKTGERRGIPDPVRAAVGGEAPGTVLPLLRTGRGSPAGLLIYNDTRFPVPYRGLLYYPDVFRQVIRAYKVEPLGATFEVTQEFEFMKSNDPLFRPCQVVLGPDGAMYVVDWRTDSGDFGQLSGDGRHGRIYRLSWAGTKEEPVLPPRGLDSWAKIAKLSDADLLNTLSAEDFSDRQKAQRELVRRGERILPALLKLVRDTRQPLPARIAALGASEAFWSAEVEGVVLLLLEDREADLRRLAADALSLNCQPQDKNAHDALLHALDDPNPAVKRALLLALGQINGPGAPDILANTLAFDEGKDRYPREGLVRAIEKLGPAGLERLLALADSGVQKDIDKVVEVVRGMRTRAAAETVPSLLANPHLSDRQRADLLRSFSNYLLDPPLDMGPALTYLEAHSDEAKVVKIAALEALVATGALRTERGQAWFQPLLDTEDGEVRTAVIRAVEESRLVKAAPSLERWLGEANRPAAERAAIEHALRALKRDP